MIEIESLRVREGRLPRRELALVLEWAADHRGELTENWREAEAHRPLIDIEPLE